MSAGDVHCAACGLTPGRGCVCLPISASVDWYTRAETTEAERDRRVRAEALREAAKAAEDIAETLDVALSLNQATFLAERAFALRDLARALRSRADDAEAG